LPNPTSVRRPSVRPLHPSYPATRQDGGTQLTSPGTARIRNGSGSRVRGAYGVPVWFRRRGTPASPTGGARPRGLTYRRVKRTATPAAGIRHSHSGSTARPLRGLARQCLPLMERLAGKKSGEKLSGACRVAGRVDGVGHRGRSGGGAGCTVVGAAA